MLQLECKIAPTDYETLLTNAFNLVDDKIKAFRIQAKLLESLGKIKDGQQYYDKVNTYFYVIYYFTLITLFVQEQQMNNLIVSYEDLETKYSLSCVRETCGCLGIDISDLIDLFNLTKDAFDIQTGIDYVNVEQGPKILTVK